jgi:hypothetical protein
MPAARRPSQHAIAAQVAAVRRERTLRPTFERLAAVLDTLNAWDAAQTARRVRTSPRLGGGPKVVEWGRPAAHGAVERGAGDEPCAAVGVVFWMRPPGFLGYRVLTVRGVWAHTARAEDDAPVSVTVGEKHLPFAHAFFDPEPYHRLFARDYATYYRDDGAPPEHRAETRPHQPDDWLSLRAWVAAALARSE